MRKLNNVRTASLTVLAASLAAAFGPAAAEDDEIARLARPESTVRLGAGYLTDDAIRFGQYNGLKSLGAYPIGDLLLVKRDDATGTWLRLEGRDLGFENRDLRFDHDRQGDWRYSVEYSKTPRFSQYVVNTGLQGIGGSNQTVSNVGLRDVRLKTEREAVTLGGQKFLGNGLDLQVRFRNERKEGNRLFGDRTNGQAFLAEPIDHTMRQVDVILGFTGEKLQLSGGYYGSFFNNDHSFLNSIDGIAPISSLGLISLPPDNEAHQFYLSGGYSFTPTARGNFKVARGVATQSDTFVNPADPAVGRTNLGGRVETTLVQAGFTARPIQKLSLLANFKHENRDDQTRERPYFTPNAATRGSLNETPSLRSNLGKVEASYQLAGGFRVIGGVDYEGRRRNVNERRQVTYREETEETSYRAELRRSLSETLNGSIAYVSSDRDGSRLEVMSAPAVAGTTTVPLHLADRERDKIRAKLDWAPAEPLSVQLMADFSRDRYDDEETFGLDKGKAQFTSLDLSYAFSDDWQGLAWVSREYSRIVNSTRSGANNWFANLQLQTEAVGVGLRGNVGSSWKVGGDLQYQHDRSQFVLSGTTAAVASLPDVKYTLTTVKLFTEYEMKSDLALRFDLAHSWWNTNDWLWEGASLGSFVYSDGTRLSQDQGQEASFIAVSMRYNWR